MNTATQTKTWTLTTTTGHTTTGYLPPWAECDPSRTEVPVDQLGMVLADVGHWAGFSGQSMPVATDDGPGTDTVVLDGSIECHPYAENPDARIPVVALQITDDYWINNLDPDELAVIAAKLRAQADRLDHEVRPALITAAPTGPPTTPREPAPLNRPGGIGSGRGAQRQR